MRRSKHERLNGKVHQNGNLEDFVEDVTGRWRMYRSVEKCRTGDWKFV